MLFRRREMLWPTLSGWLVLLALAALLALLGGRALPALLTVNEPANGPDGRGAKTLVIEGWLEADDLDQALALMRSARYQQVLTTGGPIEDSWNNVPGWSSYAERAAEYLVDRAPGGPPIVAVPAPPTEQDRTFHSALQVAAWSRGAGIELGAIDLYTAGIHSRRSRTVFEMALGPAVEVGVLAAPSPDSIAHWWTSSRSAKAVIGEALSLTWTTCCFWPDRPALSAERPVGQPKSPA